VPDESVKRMLINPSSLPDPIVRSLLEQERFFTVQKHISELIDEENSYTNEFNLNNPALQLENEINQFTTQLAIIPGFSELSPDEKMKIPAYRRLIKIIHYLELYESDLEDLNREMKRSVSRAKRLWPKFSSIYPGSSDPGRAEELFITIYTRVITDQTDISNWENYYTEEQEKNVRVLADLLGIPSDTLKEDLQMLFHDHQKFEERISPDFLEENGLQWDVIGTGAFYHYDFDILVLEEIEKELKTLLSSSITPDETLVHTLNPHPSTLFATHASQPEYLAQMAALGFMDFDKANQELKGNLGRKSGGVMWGISFQVGQVARIFGQPPNPYPYGHPLHPTKMKDGFGYFQMVTERSGGQYGVFIPYKNLLEGPNGNGVGLYSNTAWSVYFAGVKARKILELGKEAAKLWMRETNEKLTEGEWLEEYMRGDQTHWPSAAKPYDMMAHAVSLWRQMGVAETGSEPLIIEHRQQGEFQGEILVFNGREVSVDLLHPQNAAMLMVPYSELTDFLVNIFKNLSEMITEDTNPNDREEVIADRMGRILSLVMPYRERNLQLAMVALEDADLDQARENAKQEVDKAWDELKTKLLSSIQNSSNSNSPGTLGHTKQSESDPSTNVDLSWFPDDPDYTQNKAWYFESGWLGLVMGFLLFVALAVMWSIGFDLNSLSIDKPTSIFIAYFVSFIPSIFWLVSHKVIDRNRIAKYRKNNLPRATEIELLSEKRSFLGMTLGAVLLHSLGFGVGILVMNLMNLPFLLALTIGLVIYTVLHAGGHWVWNKYAPPNWVLSWVDLFPEHIAKYRAQTRGAQFAEAEMLSGSNPEPILKKYDEFLNSAEGFLKSESDPDPNYSNVDYFQMKKVLSSVINDRVHKKFHDGAARLLKNLSIIHQGFFYRDNIASALEKMRRQFPPEPDTIIVNDLTEFHEIQNSIRALEIGIRKAESYLRALNTGSHANKELLKFIFLNFAGVLLKEINVRKMDLDIYTFIKKKVMIKGFISFKPNHSMIDDPSPGSIVGSLNMAVGLALIFDENDWSTLTHLLTEVRRWSRADPSGNPSDQEQARALQISIAEIILKWELIIPKHKAFILALMFGDELESIIETYQMTIDVNTERRIHYAQATWAAWSPSDRTAILVDQFFIRMLMIKAVQNDHTSINTLNTNVEKSPWVDQPFDFQRSASQAFKYIMENDPLGSFTIGQLQSVHYSYAMGLITLHEILGQDPHSHELAGFVSDDEGDRIKSLRNLVDHGLDHVLGLPSLTTQKTMNWGRWIFDLLGFKVSDDFIRLYFAPIWEIPQSYLPGFRAAHFKNGYIADTPENRGLLGYGIATFVAVSLFVPFLIGLSLFLNTELTPKTILVIATPFLIPASAISHHLLQRWFLQNNLVKTNVDRLKESLPGLIDYELGETTVDPNSPYAIARDYLDQKIDTTYDFNELTGLVSLRMELPSIDEGDVSLWHEALQPSADKTSKATVHVRIMDAEAPVKAEIDNLQATMRGGDWAILVVDEHQISPNEMNDLNQQHQASQIRLISTREYAKLTHDGIQQLINEEPFNAVNVFIDARTQYQLPDFFIQVLRELESTEALDVDFYITVGGALSSLLTLKISLTQLVNMRLVKQRLFKLQV